MDQIKIKTIIVDDEQPSREALATYVREYCPELKICATCDSANTAYEAILKHQPSLLFLDIEMPTKNGFDLLNMFKAPEFKVIFVTAYSDYAIKAFRFSAADYLLKPVKIDELIDAVRKIKEALGTRSAIAESHPTPLPEKQEVDAIDNLIISDLDGFTVIKLDDLILCQGEGYCTHFYISGKRKITSSRNLKYYEELLLPRQVVRVHHSWLVNLHHVTGITRQGEILLSDELRCPLGSSYKNRFFRLVGRYR
jgi:two-component system LytT family response regulator